MRILASQLTDLGGLTPPGIEPGALAPKQMALSHAVGTLQPAAVATGLSVAVMNFAMKRFASVWPAC